MERLTEKMEKMRTKKPQMRTRKFTNLKIFYTPHNQLQKKTSINYDRKLSLLVFNEFRVFIYVIGVLQMLHL
jgi:hypothetical protein